MTFMHSNSTKKITPFNSMVFCTCFTLDRAGQICRGSGDWLSNFFRHDGVVRVAELGSETSDICLFSLGSNTFSGADKICNLPMILLFGFFFVQLFYIDWVHYLPRNTTFLVISVILLFLFRFKTAKSKRHCQILGRRDFFLKLKLNDLNNVRPLVF